VGTIFILTGGCRSITISGSNNKVLAEMVSAGEVSVLRESNLVAWAKPATGNDPIAFSTGKTTRELIDRSGKMPVDREGYLR
jgi:hypothetical protein